MATAERDGVLVIRAWIERDSADIRARITAASSAPDTPRSVRTAASADDVLTIVADWLRALSEED